MRHIREITFGAIIAALACIILLCAYIPYITYASAAIAGILFIAIVIEVGKKKAFLAFVVAAIFALLFAEAYSKTLFVCFFGYYPILKSVLEQIKNRFVCLALKLAVFNISAVTALFAIKNLLLMTATNIITNGLLIAGAVIVANFVFFVYDYGMNGVIRFYITRLHPIINSMIKGNK